MSNEREAGASGEAEERAGWYRERAADIRTAAVAMRRGTARRSMIELAEDYERFASRLADDRRGIV